MATITVCDGCARQSPHPVSGLHVANNWLRVRAKTNRRFDEANPCDDRLFCDGCAASVVAALKQTRDPST